MHRILVKLSELTRRLILRFTQDENVQEILDFSKEATDFRINQLLQRI